MSLLAKSKGEVTYRDISTLHKWALGDLDLDGIIDHLRANVFEECIL